MSKSYKNVYPLREVANKLSDIIINIVEEYGEEIRPIIRETTKDIANDFAEKLKQATPRSKYNAYSKRKKLKHLADTVIVTPQAKGEDTVGGVWFVHYKKWQIAHLLEFGWTMRSGRYVARTPFIRPLFDSNQDRYYNMYKERIENARI